MLYTEARARGGVGLTPGTPREHMLTWGHHRPPPGASPGHHRGLPIDHPGAARPQVGQTAPLHAPRWGRAPEFTPPGGAVVCQARHSAHDGEHCARQRWSTGTPRALCRTSGRVSCIREKKKTASVCTCPVFVPQVFNCTTCRNCNTS